MAIFHPFMTQRSHPALVALAPLAYLLACAIAAALLAYPVGGLLRGAIDFDTLVNRGGELILALGLLRLAPKLGIRAPDMGLPGRRSALWHQIRYGFLFGLLMLGLHMLLLLGLEARTLDTQKLEAARIIRLSFKALLIGVAVASIEESVFRGFLLGSLVGRLGRFGAVAVSAFYFAALHFLDTDLKPAWGDVRWDSGLILVLDAFAHLPRAELDGFLALFAAGALLGCVRVWRPLGLGYCIGLHMGWVFVIKAVKPFTHGGTHPLIPGLTSHYDGVIGYLSAGWSLALIALLVFKMVKAKGACQDS